MTITKIYDGIAGEAETYLLLNRYAERIQTAAGMEENPLYGPFAEGQWFETTEALYTHFLNVLPPLTMTGAGFVMSEYTTGDLTNGFIQIGRRYFRMTLNIPEDGGGDSHLVNAVEALFYAKKQLRAALLESA